MKTLLHVIAFLAATACLAWATDSPDKRVLCINSYHPSFSWVAEHNAALAETIGDMAQLHYFHMDTKRKPVKQNPDCIRRAMAVFREMDPDVVVLTDDNALKYLGRKITGHGTPVVYLGINGNPRDYLDTLHLSTGVLERPLLKRAIIYLKEILGDAMHNCLVLMDDSNTSRAIKQSVFGGRGRHRLGDVPTEIQLLDSFTRWKEAVLTAERYGYDVIVTGLYHTLVDESGTVIPDEEVIRWTSANSLVPVFGYWDFSVGRGKAIGGMVQDGRPQGVEAGRLVRRILRNKNQALIAPVTAEPGRFIFSRAEMARWGIVLPRDFREKFGELRYAE